MRVTEARLLELIAGAELGESLGHSGNIIDHLAMDLRDAKVAIEVLQGRVAHLQGLSDRQSKALEMMARWTV